jgi:hypothetical protein
MEVYMYLAILIGIVILAIYQWVDIDRKSKKRHEDRKEEFRSLDEQRSRSNVLLEWFSEGGMCPRCGCAESEVSPKPHQCERKCTGCGFCIEVSYE